MAARYNFLHNSHVESDTSADPSETFSNLGSDTLEKLSPNYEDTRLDPDFFGDLSDIDKSFLSTRSTLRTFLNSFRMSDNEQIEDEVPEQSEQDAADTAAAASNLTAMLQLAQSMATDNPTTPADPVPILDVHDYDKTEFRLANSPSTRFWSQPSTTGTPRTAAAPKALIPLTPEQQRHVMQSFSFLGLNISPGAHRKPRPKSVRQTEQVTAQQVALALAAAQRQIAKPPPLPPTVPITRAEF